MNSDRFRDPVYVMQDARTICASLMEAAMEKPANRTSANFCLGQPLVPGARELKINLSRAVEDGVGSAIKAERERLWYLNNASAIAEMNDYTDNQSLPLAEYRQF